MELRQLEHFVATAEERHFTRAAARVHLSQSALSTSIRALERELGARLFTRTSRHVELTEAGSALLPEARQALAAADAGRAAVAEVQGLLRGSLSIGTGKALPFAFGPILMKFRDAYPAVALSLFQAGSLELMDSVRNGRLDLALVGVTGAACHGLRTTILGGEPMVVTCARTHRLARRTRIGISDLGGEPFVDFDPSSVIRRLNDRWFAAAGIERHVAFAVNDVDALLELVASRLGIASVPTAVARRSAMVTCISVGGAAPRFETGAVVPAGRSLSVAGQRLLNMILAAIETSPVDAYPEADDRAHARLPSAPNRLATTRDDK
jgi:DNA-binding transcriptional LysR family regulator